jgi:hypothetical protein
MSFGFFQPLRPAQPQCAPMAADVPEWGGPSYTIQKKRLASEWLLIVTKRSPRRAKRLPVVWIVIPSVNPVPALAVLIATISAKPSRNNACCPATATAASAVPIIRIVARRERGLSKRDCQKRRSKQGKYNLKHVLFPLGFRNPITFRETPQDRFLVKPQAPDDAAIFKIGAEAVSRGCYVTFQMAEVAVPRQVFADILSLIAQLRAPPAPA